MAAKSKSLVGEIIELVWEDAWHSPGYYTVGEVELEGPHTLSLVGYVVRDNEDGISISPEKVLDGTGRFRHVHHVCRDMVRTVRVLK